MSGVRLLFNHPSSLLCESVPQARLCLSCGATPCFVFSASFRLCWSCPACRPSRSSSPSWWFSPFSYTTAAVTVVTGARARRRRRRTKTAARVTVTAARRGGASAASRGWRWQPSHCAGEEEGWHIIDQLHNDDIPCRHASLSHQSPHFKRKSMSRIGSSSACGC